MFTLLQWPPIPRQLRFKHLNCPTRSCMTELASLPLQPHLCVPASSVGFCHPGLPSLSRYFISLSSQAPYALSPLLRILLLCSAPAQSDLSQNVTSLAGGRVFRESPACIRSSCVAFYSSVLIVCNSLVSIFLTSVWAPGGQGLCDPCSSRRPSLPCPVSGVQ